MTDSPTKRALVHQRDETAPIDCPYGHVQRVVTGGDGGVANVHVVTVSKGGAHYHQGYDETYYVVSGQGRIEIDGATHPLRTGSVVVLPAGAVHALEADEGHTLEFVIFGTPACSVDDPRFTPRRPTSGA